MKEEIEAYRAKKDEWLAAVAVAQAAHEARNAARDAANALCEEEFSLRKGLIERLEASENELSQGASPSRSLELQAEISDLKVGLGIEEAF